MSLLRSRFSRQLIINFLFITAIAIGLVSLLNHIVNRRDLIRQTHLELNHLSREQALLVGESLLDGIDLLEAISYEESVQNKLSALEQEYAQGETESEASLQQRAEEWATGGLDDPLTESILNGPINIALERYVKLFPDYAEIVITDRYGALVSATYPVENYAQAEETWWQNAWNDGEGAIYVSQPFFDAALPDPIAEVTIARPIYSGEDIVGVIHGIYPLDLILQDLESASLVLVEAADSKGEKEKGEGEKEKAEEGGEKENAETDLPSHKGSEIRLYVSSNEYLRSEQGLAEASLTEALIANPLDGPTLFEGQKAFVTVAPVYTFENGIEPGSEAVVKLIDDLGWYILAYQDEDVALSSLKIADYLALVTAVGVFSFVIILAVFLAKKVGRPVQVLIDTAQKIQANRQSPEDLGRLNEVAQQKSDIGELATVLHGMTSSLIARQESLSHEVETLQTQLNADLQKRKTKTNMGEKEASQLELAYYEALQKKAVWLRQKSSTLNAKP